MEKEINQEVKIHKGKTMPASFVVSPQFPQHKTSNGLAGFSMGEL